MNWLRRLLRDLAGRGDDELVQLLADQVEVAMRAPQLVLDRLRGAHPDGLAAELKELEREGDQGRKRLVSELSRSLTAPIDREDLFRVSRSIDDVLDDLYDFAREYDLFQPDDPKPFVPMLEVLANGLGALRTAVRGLVDDPGQVLDWAYRSKQHGNEMRRAYEEGLAQLFAGEVRMEVFKQRELLRRLDIVALRLGEAADALADGQIKRA